MIDQHLKLPNSRRGSSAHTIISTQKSTQPATLPRTAADKGQSMCSADFAFVTCGAMAAHQLGYFRIG